MFLVVCWNDKNGTACQEQVIIMIIMIIMMIIMIIIIIIIIRTGQPAKNRCANQ